MHLGESLKVKEEAKLPKLTTCKRCNYVSSQEICKACILLEGLNRGLPRLGIGKSSKVNRLRAEQGERNACLCRTCSKKFCGCTQESVDRTESDDVIDKKCLCGGVVNKIDCKIDLKSTRELLNKLEL